LCNRCCSGKAINILYSECVFVSLDIQHEMRMRRTVICLACLVVQYFPTLSHKSHDFRKKNTFIEHKIRVLVLSKTFLNLRRNESDLIINVYWPSFKISVILVRFEGHLNFLGRFSKNPSTGSRVVPFERADKETDWLKTDREADRYD